MLSIIHTIKDPDLGVSLADLNAIDINTSTENTTLKLTLPGPITYLHNEYSRILSNINYDFSNVSFSITESSKYIKQRSSTLSNIKHIIAVSSGKGGVGKSTIACCIACELALQGAKVGILDGDIYGPSQPIMFNVNQAFMEAETDQHGHTIAYPVEQYGVKIASMGFVLNKSTSAALRGPMLGRVFNMFVEQIEWGELDYLIVDLPPGTGDIHFNFVSQLAPDGVVLVTTPQEISLADVRRGADLFKQMDVPILGIVENMSYLIIPESPNAKHYIFGQDGAKKLAVELNISVLGEIPFSIQMRENSDSGKPIILSEENNFQKEILRDITANIISELRRSNFIHNATK